MTITPLHFRRTISRVAQPKIVHGLKSYKTDCGRFIISADTSTSPTNWQVAVSINTAYAESWTEWLGIVGLCNEHFTTRRDVVVAVTAALEIDGLMDADDPTLAHS